MRSRGCLVLAAVIAIVNLPIAFIAAFLLAPLWNWVEDRFHIESIGHSGPATWALIATYLACLILEVGLWKLWSHNSADSASRP